MTDVEGIGASFVSAPADADYIGGREIAAVGTGGIGINGTDLRVECVKEVSEAGLSGVGSTDFVDCDLLWEDF